jgi:hypothetical protein
MLIRKPPKVVHRNERQRYEKSLYKEGKEAERTFFAIFAPSYRPHYASYRQDKGIRDAENQQVVVDVCFAEHHQPRHCLDL